jgi:hypothetical protein
MKLEYLPDGPNDSGLVRLYDYSSSEVHELSKLAGELATGARERIGLHGESWIAPLEGCKLILRRDERNFGIRQVGPLSFECALSVDGWNNVDGLLQPFCESATTGFQWLTSQGRISFLISRDGKW